MINPRPDWLNSLEPPPEGGLIRPTSCTILTRSIMNTNIKKNINIIIFFNFLLLFYYVLFFAIAVNIFMCINITNTMIIIST